MRSLQTAYAVYKLRTQFTRDTLVGHGFKIIVGVFVNFRGVLGTGLLYEFITSDGCDTPVIPRSQFEIDEMCSYEFF